MGLSRGRLGKDVDRRVEEFVSSLLVDVRLYKYDILGSCAHAKMLAKCKILTLKEAQKLIHALKEIEKEIEKGEFKFKLEEEDIHLNIERRLIEKLGDLGRKIHTSRSRNDQVVLDIRMYLKDKIKEICSLIKNIQLALVECAEKNIEVIIPGYTHLQHAQPVLFAHYLLAHYKAFERDKERFEDNYKRVDEMPLGSCALAGSSFKIDPNYIASLLNFSKVSSNSIDAVSDRDFVIEFLASSSILMMHFSRLSEELILFSSQEFDFIELDDAFCTGSSIMPQKKNPDVAELIRGNCGIIYGHLISLLTLMKGLPLSYNRDLQLDKEILFNTIDRLEPILSLSARMLATIKLKEKNIANQLKKGFITATNVVDYLVFKKTPFRTAYQITAELIKYCIGINKTLENLGLKEFRNFSSKFEKDILEVITLKYSVNSKNHFGGTAPSQVKTQLRKAKQKIKEHTF